MGISVVPVLAKDGQVRHALWPVVNAELAQINVAKTPLFPQFGELPRLDAYNHGRAGRIGGGSNQKCIELY